VLSCACAQPILGLHHAALAAHHRVEWAGDAPPSLVQRVRVNHRRLNARVPEQFLQRTDVVASSSGCVAKRVARRTVRNARPANRRGDRTRDRVFMQMVPTGGPFVDRG
jgi:hypothetical protein